MSATREAAVARGEPVTARVSVAPTAFVVGPARSGTSLLYKTLCLHPDVAYISNWVARYGWPWLAVLDRVPRLVPREATKLWFGADSNAYRYGRRRPWLERAFPTPVEGEPVYGRAGIARPGGSARPRDDPAASLRASFDAIRSFGGGSCVVSKRIANNLRVGLLADAFPDARFIALVRDGRAVAASLSRVDWWLDSFVWWYGGSPRRWREGGGDPWEICARNWVEELARIEDGLASVASGQVLRLRYEDLVADPIPTLTRVAGFLGVAGDDRRWRSSLATLRFSDPGRWRQELDAPTIERITRIQRDDLERYGYEA
jgi:omega-hydroxy-beta-dihydromenaquinone-9 sulfotransferase